MKLKDIHRYKNLKNSAGVYRVDCIANGKFYIGSTTNNFYTRFTAHLSRLRANKNMCYKLQRAYNKYGEDVFEISIVEIIEDKELIQSKETFYIKQLFKLDKGRTFFNRKSLNICQEASSTLGRKQSLKTRKLLSKKLKGLMSGEKHPLWGTKRKPTFLGRKHTEETRLKMSGRHPIISDERKKQISIQMSGSNHPLYGVPLNENRKRALDRTGHISHKRKPVLMLLNGVVVKEYPCMWHAQKDGHSTAHIKQCCVGIRKKHHGHQWAFKLSN